MLEIIRRNKMREQWLGLMDVHQESFGYESGNIIKHHFGTLESAIEKAKYYEKKGSNVAVMNISPSGPPFQSHIGKRLDVKRVKQRMHFPRSFA